MIDEGELREIILSCVAENGMEFDEDQVITCTSSADKRGVCKHNVAKMHIFNKKGHILLLKVVKTLMSQLK